MSKQNRLQKFSCPGRLLALWAALLVVSAPVSGVVRAQQAPVATVNPKSAAVAAATAEVLKETSELRKLPALKEVRSGAQSRAEIEKMIINNLQEESSPEEMRASELALKKLGLVPANFQMRAFIIGLLTEQVAGYYDPKTQIFYLADWIDVDGQKPVMAHELTHALQDQHFNLRRFEDWKKGDADAELAAHALIEGDASLAMTHYVMRNPLRALAMFKSMSASGGIPSEQIEKAPRALRESLLFPYQQGADFATQVYKRGGWELISKAFTELPQSSEQILHVEKYFAREAPVKVEMPDIAALLGAGWKRKDYDVNGEWSVYLILDEYLKLSAESKKAAAGWGGDRYALYEELKTGRVLLAQLLVWDTPEDAQEFFDAYVKRTNLRYANGNHETQMQRGGSSAMWKLPAPEGDVVMEQRGSRVLILEGVPRSAHVNRLMSAIWK